MKHARVPVLLLTLLLCAAAAPKSVGAKTQATPPQSDAGMEQAIRARFAKSKISADHFTVHVQGGVATIEGKTDVIQHKGVATRIGHTCGAVVVNKIQISEAAREKAAANLAKHRGGSGGTLKKSQVTMQP